MRLLVIHQNFPGQFRHLIPHWAKEPGWQVVGIGRDTATGSKCVPWVRYRLHREGHNQQHPYLRNMESAVLHGQAVARVMLDLKRKGFQPDVILAHPGWGETLYAKDVFPDARLIHYCEWYYGSPDSDVGFDSEFPPTFDDIARMRTWNALHTLNLTNCDIGISPTHWQKSRHPEIFHSKIEVIHEGINTDELRPNPQATFTTPGGLTLRPGDPVITYVARNLEPYRGFHIFMRALERIQKQHKTCHALIVGGNDVSYGRRPADAPNWREKMLREVSVDPVRTHFVGKLPYDQYVKVLQISAAHIYLTYPFVLSWSLFEAIITGCSVVASNTTPVKEYLSEGPRTSLVDFFDVEKLNRAAVETLRESIKNARTHRAAPQMKRPIGDVRSAIPAYRQLFLARKTRINRTALVINKIQ